MKNIMMLPLLQASAQAAEEFAQRYPAAVGTALAVIVTTAGKLSHMAISRFVQRVKKLEEDATAAAQAVALAQKDTAEIRGAVQRIETAVGSVSSSVDALVLLNAEEHSAIRERLVSVETRLPNGELAKLARAVDLLTARLDA